jgi:catechol 2,3-dioxygenase-like lactoylglutathione lyase family enzyme
MTMKPVVALRVADLDKALRFYETGLRFHVNWAGERTAQVTPPEGAPLLLATVSVADLSGYMNEIFSEVPVGRRMYCTMPDDLGEYREGLLARGLTPGAIHDEADGRTLEVADPDGYLISFWQPPLLTDAEVLERFDRAPGLVTDALAGLTEEQLDLVRAPGKWSIRQTVHHMADSASSSLVRVLMALAEPGRSFRQNPYSQDAWVTNLEHAHRPVGTAVALLAAITAHIGAIARGVEHPLDRHLETDLSGKVTVRRMLTMLAGHVGGHAEQIWQTRRVHGL